MFRLGWHLCTNPTNIFLQENQFESLSAQIHSLWANSLCPNNSVSFQDNFDSLLLFGWFKSKYLKIYLHSLLHLQYKCLLYSVCFMFVYSDRYNDIITDLSSTWRLPSRRFFTGLAVVKSCILPSQPELLPTNYRFSDPAITQSQLVL